MSDRLPPLTALRAFEAAARHMSFAKAADELNVTPAALSFQIKSLEEHLGQPVFHRLNRAVELTEIGALLTPGLESGFSEIASAWSRVRRFADQTILTVTAGPAFTALWLAPRLFTFAADHPDIELRFSASLKLVDFDRDDVDLAIRFGPRPDKALFSRALADEWATPMMSPELAKGVKTAGVCDRCVWRCGQVHITGWSSFTAVRPGLMLRRSWTGSTKRLIACETWRKTATLSIQWMSNVGR